MFEQGLIEQRRGGGIDQRLPGGEQFPLGGDPLHIGVTATLVGIASQLERLGQIRHHPLAHLLHGGNGLLPSVPGIEEPCPETKEGVFAAILDLIAGRLRRLHFTAIAAPAEQRHGDPGGQGCVTCFLEPAYAQLPTDIPFGLAARELHLGVAQALFAGEDLDGRAVTDPLIERLKAVGGAELEKIALQGLEVRCGLAPQRGQCHFAALQFGFQAGLRDAALPQRGSCPQDFGSGRGATLGAPGDDLVGAFGQCHGLRRQRELLLQGQGGDETLRDLAQQIQGFGATLGFHQPIAGVNQIDPGLALAAQLQHRGQRQGVFGAVDPL